MMGKPGRISRKSTQLRLVASTFLFLPLLPDLPAPWLLSRTVRWALTQPTRVLLATVYGRSSTPAWARARVAFGRIMRSLFLEGCSNETLVGSSHGSCCLDLPRYRVLWT